MPLIKKALCIWKISWEVWHLYSKPWLTIGIDIWFRKMWLEVLNGERNIFRNKKGSACVQSIGHHKPWAACYNQPHSNRVLPNLPCSHQLLLCGPFWGMGQCQGAGAFGLYFCILNSNLAKSNSDTFSLYCQTLALGHAVHENCIPS